jgi:hypothetical protein
MSSSSIVIYTGSLGLLNVDVLRDVDIFSDVDVSGIDFNITFSGVYPVSIPPCQMGCLLSPSKRVSKHVDWSST